MAGTTVRVTGEWRSGPSRKEKQGGTEKATDAT
jgi:hypothetical protein